MTEEDKNKVNESLRKIAVDMDDLVKKIQEIQGRVESLERQIQGQ